LGGVLGSVPTTVLHPTEHPPKILHPVFGGLEVGPPPPLLLLLLGLLPLPLPPPPLLLPPPPPLLLELLPPPPPVLVLPPYAVFIVSVVTSNTQHVRSMNEAKRERDDEVI